MLLIELHACDLGFHVRVHAMGCRSLIASYPPLHVCSLHERLAPKPVKVLGLETNHWGIWPLLYWAPSHPWPAIRGFMQTTMTEFAVRTGIVRKRAPLTGKALRCNDIYWTACILLHTEAEPSAAEMLGVWSLLEAIVGVKCHLPALTNACKHTSRTTSRRPGL